jgi:amino acid transporter
MSDTPRSAPQNQLKHGSLGLGFIVFFVVSAAGPLVGLAGGFPVAMLVGSGPGLPILLIVTMICILAFAVGYTAMAREVTSAGGFYSFVTKGLGGRAGGAAAALAVLGYNAMQIGLYGLFGVAAAGLAGTVGINLPWWVFVAAAWALIGFMGYRKIDLSAKVLGVLVIFEYIVALVLDFSILAKGGAHGFEIQPFTWTAAVSTAPSIGLLFCFASFIGFEATAIYSEEAKNPRKTIPLATYIAVLVVGVFNIFSAYCMVIGQGSADLVAHLGSLSDPTTFLFELSDKFAGSWVTTALHLFFVTSVFAGLLAFHNSSARYFYSMGREGLLPSKMGETHDDYKSPHIGSLVQTILAAVVLVVFIVTGADPVLALFSWLTNLSTLCVMALMAATAFAVARYFGRREEMQWQPLNIVLLPVASGLILTSILVLAILNFTVLTGASPAIAWGLTVTLPLAAVVGFVLALRLRKKDPAAFLKLGESRL